jgi:hypothetical protein
MKPLACRSSATAAAQSQAYISSSGNDLQLMAGDGGQIRIGSSDCAYLLPCSTRVQQRDVVVVVGLVVVMMVVGLVVVVVVAVVVVVGLLVAAVVVVVVGGGGGGGGCCGLYHIQTHAELSHHHTHLFVCLFVCFYFSFAARFALRITTSLLLVCGAHALRGNAHVTTLPGTADSVCAQPGLVQSLTQQLSQVSE